MMQEQYSSSKRIGRAGRRTGEKMVTGTKLRSRGNQTPRQEQIREGEKERYEIRRGERRKGRRMGKERRWSVRTKDHHCSEAGKDNGKSNQGMISGN
jgi:2-hydroxychromene-2-carboxylate isomerase